MPDIFQRIGISAPVRFRQRRPDDHLDQVAGRPGGGLRRRSRRPSSFPVADNAAVSSHRAALPLDVQNSYRARYRVMRPGWSSSGEQFEALVRSHLTPESSVLDLGCGRGGVVELFWKDVRLAAGLDPDAASLGEHRAGGMPVVTARGEQLPFARDSFDLVVSVWVLEPLPSPESVLREVHRVLRPGGHFPFLTPSLRNPLLSSAPLRRALPQLHPRLVPR